MRVVLITRLALPAVALAGAAALLVFSAASAQTPRSATPAGSVPPTAKPNLSTPQTLPPAPPPAAPTVAASPGDALVAVVQITPADNGQTVTVNLNQQIVIRLGATLNWTVSYTPESILRAVPGINARTRDVQAILYAAAPGTAQIAAEGRPQCNPGQACAQFITALKATVVVRAGGGTVQQPAPPSGRVTVQKPAAGAPSAPTGTGDTLPLTLPNTGGHSTTGSAALLIAAAAAALLAAGGSLCLRRRR